MAITSDVVELSKTVVGAGTPINCAMVTYLPEWIYVYYGTARLKAVYNTDYTVSVAGDFASFTVTPTASLVTKLNNLGQGNNIKVARYVPSTNDMTETDAFVRANLVSQFNKISMALAQLQFQFQFVPQDFATNIQAALDAVALAQAAATAAAASQSAAATSATGAASSATTAGTQASNAASSASAASTSAGAASTSAGAAATSASGAAASATTASGHATTASTQATAAAASATTASGHATTASTQATNAAASAVAAAAAAVSAAAANAALSYLFSTTTTDADPGAGTLRLNNASPASATEMYIDNTDTGAVNVTAFLDTADDSTNTAAKSVVTLRSATNPAIYAIYNLTGSVVDGTGYRKFTLTYLSGAGSFTNGMAVYLIINRVGDKGAAGAGSGDALVSQPLSQFAATTSAQLRGVLSDETGTGAAVFATSPSLSSPAITTPTGIVKGDVGLGNVDNTSDATKNSASATLSNKTLQDPVINKAITETIFTITDGAAFEVDPSNGTMQFVTLGANRTPKATNFANGESILLHVLDGTAFTLTWTDATWGGSGVVWVGGSAPTLDTTKYTVIVLWKAGGQVYGCNVGAA